MMIEKAAIGDRFRTYTWGVRNLVFLRKYFVFADRFGKKPGFFGRSASALTFLENKLINKLKYSSGTHSRE